MGFYPDSHGVRLQRLEQGLGPWIFPFFLTGVNALLNGAQDACDAFGDPRFKRFGYRLGVGPEGYEFCGHLVIPSSPIVVTTIIDDLWPQFVQSGPVDIASTPDPGSAFVIGRAFVNPDNGEITVTLP